MNTHLLAQKLTLPGGSLTGGTYTSGDGTTITGPVEGFNNLGTLISRLIPYFVLFAGVGLLIMIIISGFQILAGASNPKTLESGKQRLTYAIVGFIIVFFAFWIVQLIGIMFGIREWSIFGINIAGSGGGGGNFK